MTTAPISTPFSNLRLRSSGPTWVWVIFFVCALITVGFFFVPAFVIRPFSYQAPRALLVAMALRQRAPLGTLIASLASLGFAFVLWKAVNLWRRIAVVVVMILVTFSAVMARLNYFEWMFHPIVSQQFVAQSESKLDPKEMIMAIRYGDDARAYPISQMAYHHVLNDTVGGVPVVVTY
jgi:Kef-type K+ transport system membrane component KefB